MTFAALCRYFSSRVTRMGIVGVVILWSSMLSLAEAARSPTRPFQMSILASTDSLQGAGVDIPIFTQNVYSTYQAQPAGLSIAWLPPDPNLDRHAIDWSRIVAVYVDEPYGEILKNRTSCVGTPSPIADLMTTLEAMAAEVRRRAPSARFWVNFTKKEIDLMHSATANCPLNQPYIDVISMDIYGVAFKPTLRDRYNYLFAHRATSSQQLALVPGTFTEGWEKQTGRQGAARLSGYFAYAASMNQQCNLPLGPRGVTGTYDGCPVWMVAGWWGGATPLDENPRDYFPIEHASSAPVLKAWRRQFAVPRVDPSRHDNAIVDGFVAREYQSRAGVKLPYRLHVPSSAKRDEELPLILYLHGSGGAGTDNRKQISGGNAQGTHIWIEPAMQERHPAFVLAPQIPETLKWHSSGNEPLPHVAALLELLEELRSQLRIDARRVYVVGQSLGGFGAWDLIARYPDIFAAAVPLCGGGDTKRILMARDVAVWAFHGAKDATVLASRSSEMVAALSTVNSSVRYTEYPDVGHDVWTRAFAERDLPEWMFAQRRR